MLQITPVEMGDAGRYRCSAQNDGGENSSQDFLLNITTTISDGFILPQTPLIVGAPRNATLKPGSVYLLECLVSSMFLEVEWSRKGKGGEGAGVGQRQGWGRGRGEGNTLITHRANN